MNTVIGQHRYIVNLLFATSCIYCDFINFSRQQIGKFETIERKIDRKEEIDLVVTYMYMLYTGSIFDQAKRNRRCNCQNIHRQEREQKQITLYLFELC